MVKTMAMTPEIKEVDTEPHLQIPKIPEEPEVIATREGI